MQPGGEMRHGREGPRFLLPTDQNTTVSVHPTVSPFSHPATSLDPCGMSDQLGLIAARANMRRRPAVAYRAQVRAHQPDCLVVVSEKTSVWKTPRESFRLPAADGLRPPLNENPSMVPGKSRRGLSDARLAARARPGTVRNDSPASVSYDGLQLFITYWFSLTYDNAVRCESRAAGR